MKNKTAINVYTDGGARGNPGPAGIGIYIEDNLGNMLYQRGEKIGTATNNIAEYTALLHAMTWVANHLAEFQNVESITFFLDSQLVVMQMSGIYKIKNQDLAVLAARIREKQAQIALPVRYSHVPREQNKKADAQVNLALDNKL